MKVSINVRITTQPDIIIFKALSNNDNYYTFFSSLLTVVWSSTYFTPQQHLRLGGRLLNSSNTTPASYASLLVNSAARHNRKFNSLAARPPLTLDGAATGGASRCRLSINAHPVTLHLMDGRSRAEGSARSVAMIWVVEWPRFTSLFPQRWSRTELLGHIWRDARLTQLQYLCTGSTRLDTDPKQS